MSDNTDKEMLEQIHAGVKQTQDRLDVLEAKGQEADPIDKEYIEKAIGSAADGIEKKWEERQKESAEKFEAKMKAMNIVLASKTGGDGKAPLTEEEKERKHLIQTFIREGAVIDRKAIEKIADEICQKTLFTTDEKAHMLEQKELVGGNGPQGGYLLMPADRSAQIMMRIFETSPMRTLANVETTTSGEFEYLLDDDEAEFGWVGEVESRPTTDTPDVGVIKIPVHEVFARPRATQTLLDDAGIDVEGWLSRKIENRFMRAENAAFVTGSGSRRPRGFTQYDNWDTSGVYQRDRVERIDTAAGGDFTGDDLINLQNSLLEDYQMNATWAMHRVTFTKVAQLKGTDGQYLLDRTLLFNGTMKMLLGNDVVFFNDMTRSSSTANDLPIAIADWNQFYTVVDRFGIRVIRDNVTQPPYVRFYSSKRVGGAVTNYQAGKIMRIS